jgi:hypothetical protein
LLPALSTRESKSERSPGASAMPNQNGLSRRTSVDRLPRRDIEEIHRWLVRGITEFDEIESPLADSKVDAVAQAVDDTDFGAAIDWTRQIEDGDAVCFE